MPEKHTLIDHARRIRGQIDDVERMLVEEKSCAEVMQVIAGVRNAVNGLMGEVIEVHVNARVAAEDLGETERDDGTAELVEVLRAYMK